VKSFLFIDITYSRYQKAHFQFKEQQKQLTREIKEIDTQLSFRQTDF